MLMMYAYVCVYCKMIHSPYNIEYFNSLQFTGTQSTMPSLIPPMRAEFSFVVPFSFQVSVLAVYGISLQPFDCSD